MRMKQYLQSASKVVRRDKVPLKNCGSFNVEEPFGRGGMGIEKGGGGTVAEGVPPNKDPDVFFTKLGGGGFGLLVRVM